MIKSITVTNHLNESLTMELTSPEKSGFIVLNVDGLGPVKGEISFIPNAGLDGASYNSARASYRNVILELQFYYGQYDIETLRQITYKYFPLKEELTFRIDSDNRILKGTGYVESNDPTIFSEKEGTAISIMFPDSYLYDYIGQETSLLLLTNNFEFPFSNESLVSPLLEFGVLSLESTKSISYYGDVPVGMLIHIHANGSASGLKITNSVTLEKIEIDSTKLAAIVGSDISVGDDIWISTVRGNKYAILIRSATTYNILSTLGTSPDWLELKRGSNTFAFTATSGIANLYFEIFNEIAYEGI